MLNFPNNVTALKKEEGEKLQRICTIMKRQNEEEEISNVAETKKMLDKLEKERQVTTIIQNMFQVMLCGF